MRTRLAEVAKKGRILVSDGAWGTFLQQKGLQPGDCPDLWSVSHPETVIDIARAYLEAGADMIETNSFGASSIKLAQHDLQDRAAEINQAAAMLSRKAAGEDKWVLGAMGPTGKMILSGQVTPEELYASFRQQATALERGGADAICIETMFDLDEAIQAVTAAKENTACEIISTFTFELTKRGEFRTMMGVTPASYAQAVVDAGADILGTNCGNGMQQMVDIVKEIKAAFPEKPILVHANAGLPESIDGRDVYRETPEEMADLVPALIDAGANIIGGCCGTNPKHIERIKKAVNALGLAYSG